MGIRNSEKNVGFTINPYYQIKRTIFKEKVNMELRVEKGLSKNNSPHFVKKKKLDKIRGQFIGKFSSNMPIDLDKLKDSDDNKREVSSYIGQSSKLIKKMVRNNKISGGYRNKLFSKKRMK